MAHRPVQRTDDYLEGDFSFIKEPLLREIYTHDYKAVQSIPGLWKFLENYPSDLPLLLNNYLDKLLKVTWEKHTINSLNKSMNVMRSIAKFGWENYVFLIRD